MKEKEIKMLLGKALDKATEEYCTGKYDCDECPCFELCKTITKAQEEI